MSNYIETEDSKHDARCVWHSNKKRGIHAYDCNCGAHERRRVETEKLRSEYQRLLNELDRPGLKL